MAKVVVCETMLKPLEVILASSQGDGSTYTVIGRTVYNDPVCDCKGFQFRGTCKHVKAVDEAMCNFHRVPTDEEQQGADLGRCPTCLHPLILFELEPEWE